MQWKLPGTVLEAPLEREEAAEEVLSSLFLTGGLVLSQVTQITGMQQHIVQNWVRRGFLPPPVGRKYGKSQLCRILTINALKSALAIEDICRLLRYVNGSLTDRSDDTIDDTDLYLAFASLQESLAGYEEPVPGARGRIEEVLTIMLMAWRSSELRTEAGRRLSLLPKAEQTETEV